MERAYFLVIVVAVGITAMVGARFSLSCTGQAVDTAVIAGRAGSVVIVCLRGESQNPKVIVEGVVFLHHDDDVVHPAHAAVLCGGFITARVARAGGGVNQTRQCQAPSRANELSSQTCP